MSRIIFHSEHGTADLDGSEGRHLLALATAPARSYWADWLDGPGELDRLSDLIGLIRPGDHLAYLHRLLADAQGGPSNSDTGTVSKLREATLAALQTGVRLQVAGVALNSQDLNLNTALTLRSPLLALAAKISSWCSHSCWIEGPDRAWIASLIEHGLENGAYRKGLTVPSQSGTSRYLSQGWEDCVRLLRARDDGPVVLTDSASNSFPDAELTLDWPQQPSEDEAEQLRAAFDALPAGQRWAQAVQGLRRRRPWARLGEDTLFTVTFRHPVSVLDILAVDCGARVAAAALTAEELPQ